MKVCKLSVLLSVLLCLAALAVHSSSALAATIVLSDNFDVPDGNLNGTTPDVGLGNWTATQDVAEDIQIVGQRVFLEGSGEDSYAAFTAPISTGSAWGLLSSLDINVSSATAAGDYFFHLSNPAGTTSVFVQRLFARSATGGYQLGLVGTSGGTTSWGTDVLSFGQTYSVDVGWEFVAGPLNDKFRVSVDGTPYLSHTWDSATAEPTALAAGNFRQGGGATAATLFADNLVVQSVPEPSTLILSSLLGALCMNFRRRTA